MAHVAQCSPAPSPPSEALIANIFFRQGNIGRGVDSPLTWYPRDGDLLATAAIPSLSKRLYLNDIILISGQGKLHRGGVGFHDVGVAVLILLVEHLVTNGRSQLKSQAI